MLKTIVVVVLAFAIAATSAVAGSSRRHVLPWYVAKQLRVATILGQAGDRAGTDPWPNCPDPYDHRGATWWDTLRCENHGSWLDSPGYYRCGLQFDPMWERRYGRLCP